MLTRVLLPNTVAIRCLSKEDGIAAATLHKWRSDARASGQRLPDADADAGSEGWTSRDTFAAVLETAAMNEGISANTAVGAEFTRRRSRHGGWLVSRRLIGTAPARPVCALRLSKTGNGSRIRLRHQGLRADLGEILRPLV